MGAMLGVVIFACSFVWTGLPRDVALTVAISLPTVSIWANILGGIFPLLSAHVGKNPAVVSAPLMTTVVDATGLAIYLGLARIIMGI
jgi:magnesium transporter